MAAIGQSGGAVSRSGPKLALAELSEGTTRVPPRFLRASSGFELRHTDHGGVALCHAHRMDVLLLYFDECPNWRVANDRLRTALDATGHEMVTIRCEEVRTVDEAVSRKFMGSPSIFIDGLDPFAREGDTPGLACRMYASTEGLGGSPTEVDLITAINQANQFR